MPMHLNRAEVERRIGYEPFTEHEALTHLLEAEGYLGYDTEVGMYDDGSLERNVAMNWPPFRVDAVVHKHAFESVAIEAKLLVLDGDELIRGDPSDGFEQACRYEPHFDHAETWHLYCVPRDELGVEVALTMMANLHEMTQNWAEQLPVNHRSVAVQQTMSDPRCVGSCGETALLNET